MGSNHFILSDRIVIEPKKSNVEIFHLYFFKWDISFLISNKLTKLYVANLGTLLEGTLSQIVYLRLSLDFMTKNGKPFAFV